MRTQFVWLRKKIGRLTILLKLATVFKTLEDLQKEFNNAAASNLC